MLQCLSMLVICYSFLCGENVFIYLIVFFLPRILNYRFVFWVCFFWTEVVYMSIKCFCKDRHAFTDTSANAYLISSVQTLFFHIFYRSRWEVQVAFFGIKKYQSKAEILRFEIQLHNRNAHGLKS